MTWFQLPCRDTGESGDPLRAPRIPRGGLFPTVPRLGGFPVHFMGSRTLKLPVYILAGICILSGEMFQCTQADQGQDEPSLGRYLGSDLLGPSDANLAVSGTSQDTIHL